MRHVVLQVLCGALVAWGQAPGEPATEIASAIRAHQYERAVTLARTTLQRSPGDVRVLTMEAIALSGLGNDHDALAAFQQALRLAPDYLAALEGAAQIEYKSGSERAVPLLDHLLQLQPGNATAHAMRAVMAWKRKDCETAVRHFALAGSAISTEPDALQQYVACLARLERPAEAIPVLRQLAALEPGNARVRYRLAAAQFMAKSFAEAIETLGPSIEGKDPDPGALDLAAAAWEALGDTPRAVAALRQAIVLAPSDARLYVDFASFCLVHKSYQVGIDMIDAGLTQVPDASKLYVARGVLNVQLAQYDQADADFARAEHLDPRQAYGSLALGLSQVQQNDFEKALATVREQLKTRRTDAFLYYMLAEILSSRGAPAGSAEYNEAIGAASHAVELKPDFALARDVLSRLYLASGQVDRAIEQCRLALRDNPLDATALYRLIRALQKSGRPDADRELPALLQRFNDLREQLGRQEAAEGRYKLVEGQPEPGKPIR
jgi:tetratricopeptide (TPR) repeat protein